jgi:hypothetical protein
MEPERLPSGELNLARLPPAVQRLYIQLWTMARRFEPETSEKRQQAERAGAAQGAGRSGAAENRGQNVETEP